MSESAVMEFADLDTAAVARCLSQLEERPEDLVDAFFEATEEIELPVDQDEPGLRVGREEGLAVRLTRAGRTWLASRDLLDGRSFAAAQRQVARTLPEASYTPPELGRIVRLEGEVAAELLDFPARLDRRLRQHHVAFRRRMHVRRHQRLVQVVGSRLVPLPERECFFSIDLDSSWGRYGALTTQLDDAFVDRVADELVFRFRARDAAPAESQNGVVVLGATATAVLLHEAVAHALEADLLALTGRPEAAVGVQLGGEDLHVLDDPGSAPDGVRRATDDEGSRVRRRWLLRGGVVEDPLADQAFAHASESLTPGAARRAHRHEPPSPRCAHLELLPGSYSMDDLLHDARGGLFIPAVERGRYDPLTGELELTASCARRISGGALGRPVGRCRISGVLPDVLGAVKAVGRRSETGGAGWCAKAGRRVPVWATAPALRLEGLQVGHA